MNAASPGRVLLFTAVAVATATAESVRGQVASTEGVVAVMAAEQDTDDWSGATLGFVADSDLVIADVDGSARLFSVLAAADSGDTRYEARLLAYDVASGLGLLSVTGLGVSPYVFALGAPRTGQEVHGIAWEPAGDSAESAAIRALSLVTGAAVDVDTLAEGGRGVIRHDALADGGRNVGGPLFNTCGEVVGVVVQPEGSDDGSSRSEVAALASALLSRFEIDGLTAQVAADVCLSAEEQREAEQQARLVRETARADSLEAAARAERARRAELERVRDSVSDANEAATQEATELREQRDSLAEATRSTQESVRLRTYIGVAAAGVVILLVGLAAVRASGRAKRRAALARQEAEDSERKAAQATEAAARAGEAAREAAADLAAREARERMAGQVPEVLIERVGGPPMAVKIAGRMVADEGGAIIGRSPFVSQVVLNHPEVSRKHFRLLARGTAVLVEDLGSTNGTILDGTRLHPGAPMPLGNGARLEIGGLSFVATLRASGSAPGKNAIQEES